MTLTQLYKQAEKTENKRIAHLDGVYLFSKRKECDEEVTKLIEEVAEFKEKLGLALGCLLIIRERVERDKSLGGDVDTLSEIDESIEQTSKQIEGNFMTNKTNTVLLGQWPSNGVKQHNQQKERGDD